MADEETKTTGAADGSAATSQTAQAGATPAEAGAGDATQKRAGIATGVQSTVKDPSAGVEVFPGVDAKAFNDRQSKRRETRSDTF